MYPTAVKGTTLGNRNACSCRRVKAKSVLCHGTCLLLKAKVDGKPLVTGKTWTGFANSEEDYADDFVGQSMQPFRIEEEAKKIPDTNFIVSGRFKAHAVRDGNLITGQQQYSALAVARLVIAALGYSVCRRWQKSERFLCNISQS